MTSHENKADYYACDDCQKQFHMDLLDCVLLDEEGSLTSEEFYCRDCWPKHKKVSYDAYSAPTFYEVSTPK